MKLPEVPRSVALGNSFHRGPDSRCARPAPRQIRCLQGEIPATPAERSWPMVSFFNSGDADRIQKFSSSPFGSGHRNMQRDLNLREQNGASSCSGL